MIRIDEKFRLPLHTLKEMRAARKEIHEASDKIEVLEKELLRLYNPVVTHENGRLRNLANNDSEGWNELSRAFPSLSKTSTDYTHLWYSVFTIGLTGSPNTLYLMRQRIHTMYGQSKKKQNIPLPPFIVFPSYSPSSIGWRMGSGEDYLMFWNEIMRVLPESEREEYCSRFDYPSWWTASGNPSVFCPAMFYDLPWRNKSQYSS